MASEKLTKNAQGAFRLTRQDKSQEFVCDRCLEPKISKVMVEWTDTNGRVKTICNGCYGRLSSDVPL